MKDSSPDHRELNRTLEIFATDPLVGSGLPLLLPAGSVIRAELERLAAELAGRDGCLEVRTPSLAKRALFERSGHWDKFSDDMFPPMPVGGDELVLRPANCPHHALVYAARQRSWRDLPVRLHELAPMFRAERSGVLSGLSRVRQISLDDTHVFCRPDQLAHEAASALATAVEAQRILGLPVSYLRLSRRDDGEGYLGSTVWWSEAEQALRAAVAGVDLGDLEVVEAAGEAAFYGPKLDLQVIDGRGQEETIATVQVDGVQPVRLGLRYDAADGSRQQVVMVHRGTIGSMERVTAALLEQDNGWLPVWLAPAQVACLPVSGDQDVEARRLHERLLAAGLRSELRLDGSVGSRVRWCRERRVPLIAVIGSSEQAAGEVQVDDLRSRSRRRMSPDQLVSALREARRTRSRDIS